MWIAFAKPKALAKDFNNFSINVLQPPYLNLSENKYQQNKKLGISPSFFETFYCFTAGNGRICLA